jgi:TPR repeat protein
MKIPLKFITLLLLCFFVVLIFGASIGICGSSIEDLRIAAEKGDAEAQYNLGSAYYAGKRVSKNLTEAVKWVRKASEQGNADAQTFLGWLYEEGKGVPKNLVEAVKWYQKAAEQGSAYAQHNLGFCYENGRGVQKNMVEAIKWYRKAAEQGTEEAQHALAQCYALGEGVSENVAEAIKWYRKAAEQGFADSQRNLGVCYKYGVGVPKDEVEALAWLNIAAGNGNQLAMKDREELERQLGRQASLLSQQRSKEIVKEIESAKQKRAKTGEPAQRPPQLADGKAELKGSGTGVIVSSNGLILTAAHVVDQSTDVKVATQKGLKAARVVKLDNANDLALLKCEGSFQSAPVKSSSGIKLGQSVFTIGFPNIGFQGFSPKMTKGEINSLSGLQDDPRHWQISVPVQPGNSGGPLFDEAGNVVGVVLSKLDAIKVAKFTGDLPQNVNYAVKSIYALPLLEPYAANLASETAASTSPKMLEGVIEKVQGSVVLILVY